MVSAMGLTMAELERGDGAWANIQAVLRDAFRLHETQLRHHSERLDTTERRSTSLEEKWARASESLTKLQGLPAHVDTLARVVNMLSEELKQRVQADQERQQQQTKWMASMTHSVETQLDALHQRFVGDMESTYSKAIAAMERRMDLVEEELGHIVVALEQRVDRETFNAHKQLMDDALKQRCRKTAFDKEVVRVHQLLRSQHFKMNQQIDEFQKRFEEQLTKQRQLHDQQQSQASVDSENYRHLKRDILSDVMQRLQAGSDESKQYVDTQLTGVQAMMHQHVEEMAMKHKEDLLSSFQKAIKESDVTGQVAKIERESNDRHQQNVSTLNGLLTKINSLREEHSKNLSMITEKVDLSGRRHSETQAICDKRLADLEDELQKLQKTISEVDQGTKQHTERVESAIKRYEQQQLPLQDEVRELARARDKKTRQQMHLVADKLQEMDQILKLVGKQLVQNTSQLQLLWIDEHDVTSTDDQDDIKLLEADNTSSEDPQLLLENSLHEPEQPIVGADDDAMQRERHQKLQASIAAKLRDYETVLSIDPQPVNE